MSNTNKAKSKNTNKTNVDSLQGGVNSQLKENGAQATPSAKEKTADVNRSQLLLSQSFHGFDNSGKAIQMTVTDLGLQFDALETKVSYITDNVLCMAKHCITLAEANKPKSVKRSTILATAADSFKAICKALELSMKWGKAEKGSTKEIREAFHAAPKTYANVKSIINQSFANGIDVAKFDHVSGQKGLEVMLQATKVANQSDDDTTTTTDDDEATPNAADQAIDAAIASEVSPELVACVESVLALGQKLPESQQAEMVAAVNTAIQSFKDVAQSLKDEGSESEETPHTAGKVS